MNTFQKASDVDSSRRATYQDVLDAPCHKVAEIVNGMLYISSRPAALQTFASSRLLGILG